ncbi:MAG: molybdopterin-synthase adenylyltransferase MoeB [Anaerolineae bacterium]
MATVRIPSPLRRYTNGQAKVQAEGSTIASLLDSLDHQYPGVKSRICDDNGQIKRYVNIFVNDEEIRSLQGADTSVAERDEISIIPAMAGGSGFMSTQQLLDVARQYVDEVDIHELKRALDNGEELYLVDMRERDEFVQGHIPGAVYIPRGFLEFHMEELAPDRNTPIVLYCAGGVRSLLAGRALKEMGYTNVKSLQAGYLGWKNAGYEFVVPRVLNDEQRNRYSRHIMIPEVGEFGQNRLLDAKVLLIGAGGLGSPAAIYLAAAGVGTIGIVDFDVVDTSNLQRQIIHRLDDLDRPKVDSAADAITRLNPDVKVIGHQTQITSENALEIIGEYDVVLNGSDNFPTRYLINDACVILGKPLVDASIFRFDGQVTVYDTANGSPCYRCLYPDPPPPGEVPSCAEGGVLGVLPGIIGSVQAVEAIKLVLGIGEVLRGRLLVYDALEGEFREVRIRKDEACPVCSVDPGAVQLIDYEQFCGLLPAPASAENGVPVLA